MLGNILLGLILVGVGLAICYYSYKLVKVFGRIGMAERYLGSTRTAYLLAGFVTTVIGFMFMFGILAVS